MATWNEITDGGSDSGSSVLTLQEVGGTVSEYDTITGNIGLLEDPTPGDGFILSGGSGIVTINVSVTNITGLITADPSDIGNFYVAIFGPLDDLLYPYMFDGQSEDIYLLTGLTVADGLDHTSFQITTTTPMNPAKTYALIIDWQGDHVDYSINLQFPSQIFWTAFYKTEETVV